MMAISNPFAQETRNSPFPGLVAKPGLLHKLDAGRWIFLWQVRIDQELQIRHDKSEYPSIEKQPVRIAQSPSKIAQRKMFKDV